MATTTPNYGWPVPTSGDLVKDGATAIEALGDAIDATVFAQTSGLVLINTTALSGVTSQSLNNVFSSTYDNYKIIIKASGTIAPINLRVRASGTDLTSSNYYGAVRQIASSTTTIANDNFDPTTSMKVSYTASSMSTGIAEIGSPFLATYTTYFTHVGYLDSTNEGYYTFGGGGISTTSSYDGFTLICANAMTGSVSVYGYKK